MIASAPSSSATSTLRHSSASSARSPEMPRLTFTLVRRPSPTPSGESDVWWMLAGMAMRPAATPARMNSGSRPSLRATSAIWGVTTPARAKSIWVTGCADACRSSTRRDIRFSLRWHYPCQVLRVGACAPPLSPPRACAPHELPGAVLPRRHGFSISTRTGRASRVYGKGWKTRTVPRSTPIVAGCPMNSLEMPRDTRLVSGSSSME